MTPRLFPAIGLAWALAAAALPASAAEGDELAQLLAQPVYGASRIASASKYDQDAADAPTLVYVRTGGEIRAQGYRTLAEVLESLPGIHLRSDRTYTYTGVRGISRPGDYSSRLLLLIDGVRINEAMYDSATGGREFPLDIGLIDRVEFVPGPGSALYGTNAVLGVVNVITRNPSQVAGLNATLEAASGHARKLTMTWGGSAGPARLVFSAVSERRDGNPRLYYPEFDTPADHFGVAEGRDGERNDKLFLKALWNDFRFTAALSARVKDDPTGGYGVIFNGRSESSDRYALADIAYARAWGEQHEVFARFGLARYRYHGFAEYGSVDAILPGESRSEASWASGELRYVWSGWSAHRLLLGAEFQNNFRQYTYSADLPPVPFVYADQVTHTSRWSLFVNDEWQLRPGLRLNLGLRSDRRLDGHQTTSPRLSAWWSPDAAWTFKLQHGSAFREPNVAETSFLAPAQQSGKPLSVESMRANEASASWRPSPGLELSASAYSLHINDSIVLVSQSSGVEDYQNVGRIRSHGLELEATQTVGRLQVRASWSVQRGIDRETGATLSDSPRALFKLMVTTPGPWAGSTVGANLQHVGERLTLAGARLPSHVRVNAQVMHQPADRAWTLGLAVYNLTGSRYADPGGPEHLQDTLAQDGRRWRLQLGWSF